MYNIYINFSKMQLYALFAFSLLMTTSLPSAAQTVTNDDKKAYKTRSILLINSSDEHFKNLLKLSVAEKQLKPRYATGGGSVNYDLDLVISIKEYDSIYCYLSAYIKDVETKHNLESSDCHNFKKYTGFAVILFNRKSCNEMEFLGGDCNKLDAFFSSFESWIKGNNALSSACKISLLVHITRLRNLNLN